MEYVNSLITSFEANAFFGGGDLCVNKTLRSVLRFVALTHNQGDIEKIKPIECQFLQCRTNASGNYYANAAKEAGVELTILTAPRGEQLLTISDDDWVSLDTLPYPVAPFLSTVSETHVYSNTSARSTVIFVKRATEKWIDTISSIIFRVLPWRFEDGIANEEVALFKAINKRDNNAFVKIINDACAQYDFKKIAYRRTLLGWNNGSLERQIADFEKKAKDTMQNIANYQNLLSEQLNKLNDYNTNLLALQAHNNSADDSVFNFFMNHRDIIITKTQLGAPYGNVMNYCVLETLEFFDFDEFLRIYNNNSSVLGQASKAIRDIFFAIFGLEKPKGKIRVEAMFELIGLSSLSPLRGVRSNSYNDICIPHPHIYGYGCLGTNALYINNYMQQGDWDMAIEQSVAATKNINFGDVTVIETFVRYLENSMDSCKCIIADNGEGMTPREFLSYINENKEIEEIENG